MSELEELHLEYALVWDKYSQDKYTQEGWQSTNWHASLEKALKHAQDGDVLVCRAVSELVAVDPEAL